MRAVPRVGVWVIATGVILAFLHVGRAILSPFAMAVFLFLVMEGFAEAIDRASHWIGQRIGRLLSVILVLIGFGLFVIMMANGVAQFSSQAGLYETRINQLIADAYSLLHIPNAPSLAKLVMGETGQKFFSTLAGAVGELSESLMLILIYLAFLYLASSAWTRKLDAIFPDPQRREVARRVSQDARKGIVDYIWIQTVISAIITALTWVTLTLFGVDNALFLSGLTFVLNYIPTIGSIVAAMVPALFALVQPEGAWPAWMPDNTYINAALVFGGVSVWQFVIGNFLQPRMMGESLNLSALVVLLSLAVWGALWGIPGMFLSAPLTVTLMIIMAQSGETYWLAVLLSANGHPGPDPRRAPAPAAEISANVSSR